MTAEDVKSKSKTETEARDISFPLTVPAHEGRIVSVKTTVASTDTFYEASLRAEGAVGIEVDLGWTIGHIFFNNIEFVFPYAEAKSRITCGLTYTDVDSETKIIEAKPTDAKDATDKLEDDAEILEYYIPFDIDQPAAALKSPDNLSFAISSDAKDGPPQAGTPTGTFLSVLRIRVQFAGVKPEVPPEKRRPGIKLFVGRLTFSDISFFRPPSPVSYANKDISATFSLTYDATVITKEKLKVDVFKVAKQILWGGAVKLYFS
jgi:hypothetical protein